MKRQTLLLLGLIIFAFVLAFTPFYSVGYIIIGCVAAIHLNFSTIFSSFFSRIILAFLLLATAIMLAGLGSWLIHLQLYPITVFITYLAIALLLIRVRAIPINPHQFLDKGDVISLCLALLTPLIILFSFYFPHPSNAATYQFLSTGWDNGGHINILQDVSQYHGYTYGKGNPKEINNSLDRSRAYPQGWHLATANFANGFNLNPFNAAKPIQLMNYYLVIYLLWYVIAVYCFTRVAWVLASKSFSKNRGSPFLVLVFALPCLLVQLVAYDGSIVHGFANYIGCMAFLSVLFALLIDTDNRNKTSLYIASLLFVIAVTLSWLLPLPAAALAMLIAFWPSNLRHYLSRQSINGKYIFLVLLTLVALGVALLQALIFKSFTQVEDPQINAGSLSGTFPISPLLVLFVSTISASYLMQRKKHSSNQFIAITTPFLILASAIYIYQIFTIGTTSYYFGKILALSLMAVSLFFIPAFVSLMESLRVSQRLSSMSLIVLSVAVVGLLIVGSHQSTSSLNYLFQRNSKVTYQTSKAVVNYLEKADPAHTKLVVMRHEKRAEDDNGYMHNLLANMEFTCANHVTGSPVLSIQIHNLKKCSDKLEKSHINLWVITSDTTYLQVKKLDRQNIKIINVAS